MGFEVTGHIDMYVYIYIYNRLENESNFWENCSNYGNPLMLGRRALYFKLVIVVKQKQLLPQ